MSKKCAVYKAFNADAALIYVGISFDPAVRLRNHKSTSRWFPEMHRSELVWLNSRSDAEKYEFEIIRDERPLYNIQRGTNQSPPITPMVFSEEEKGGEVYKYIMRINSWLKDTNTKETRLGLLACANGSAIKRIRSGSASVNSLRDVLKYIEQNPAEQG